MLLRPFRSAVPTGSSWSGSAAARRSRGNIVAGHEFPGQARSRSFAHMAAIAFDREYDLTGAGEPLKLVAARVTSGFFPVMGVAPQLGRPFTTAENRPGSDLVTVISDGLWRARFDADPAIAGRAIQLNGVPYTVVGVMPAGFHFPQGPSGVPPDIWTPIAEPIHLYRGRHYLSVVARLHDGVTLAQAQSEMDAIAGGIEQEMPQFSRGHGANVQPLHGEIVQQFRRAISCSSRASRSSCSSRAATWRTAPRACRRPAARDRRPHRAGRRRLRVARNSGGRAVSPRRRRRRDSRCPVLCPSPDVIPGRYRTADDARLDVRVLAFAAGASAITALVFGLVPLAQAMRVQVASA